MQWEPIDPETIISAGSPLFGTATVNWPCPCGALIRWVGTPVTVCTQCGRLYRYTAVVHMAGPPAEPDAAALIEGRRVAYDG